MAEATDLIIVGGGMAGLTAAIYAARANLRVLLLEKEVCGGLANQTQIVENFPSHLQINGMELMERVAEQASRLGVQVEEIAEVLRIETGMPKRVVTEEGSFEAGALILATGRIPVPLPIENDWEEHIHYCSVCDGAFYRGKDLIVVGGGNSGFDESLTLANLGVNSIELLEALDHFPADPVTREKAVATGKVRASNGARIVDIENLGKRGRVRIERQETGEQETMTVDGIFVFIGQKPNTEFLRDTVRLDENGYIITDPNLHTSVEGIFAAGDVVVKKYRQLTTAMADGTIAALEAVRYLRSGEAS